MSTQAPGGYSATPSTSTIPGWIGGEWDRVKLGEDYLPGIAWAEPEVSQDVQAVKSPKTDGITLKDNGENASTVTITCEVWSERGGRDLSRLSALVAILDKYVKRKPGIEQAPVAIVHPATSIAGITHVYPLKYKIPRPSGGRLVVTVDCMRYYPPEAKKGTQQGAPKPPDNGGPIADGSVPAADPENLGMDAG